MVSNQQDIVVEAKVSKKYQFGGVWERSCYLVYF